MQALLLDPTVPTTRQFRGGKWAPLGLAYLSAALRAAGHHTRLHNRCNLRAWRGLSLTELDAATEQLIGRIRPDLIGISGVTASFGDTVAVAEIARRVCPEALIVLGGAHATTVPRETLERIPGADCLVLGEGEERIVQLAAGVPPRDLPGVAWRDSGGEVQVNPWKAPEWTLDSMPLPARDLLDIPKYIRRSRPAIRGAYLRSTTLISSRGCHNRCAFCSEPAYSIRGYRTHSPERTIIEAKTLVAQYRVPALAFLDENFTCERDRVMRLMHLWGQGGLAEQVKFAIQARADAVDEELLAALRDAGCIHIELGIESGSDRVLKRMNKGCTVAQNVAAAEMVKRTGIRLQANIICGTPGETEEELLASLELLEALEPEIASILPYMILPGTAFARELIAEGRLAPDFWDVRDREKIQPIPNVSAMSDETFNEIYARGKCLAQRLYRESSCEPWWLRAARTVKRRFAGLAARSSA